MLIFERSSARPALVANVRASVVRTSVNPTTPSKVPSRFRHARPPIMRFSLPYSGCLSLFLLMHKRFNCFIQLVTNHLWEAVTDDTFRVDQVYRREALDLPPLGEPAARGSAVPPRTPGQVLPLTL